MSSRLTGAEQLQRALRQYGDGSTRALGGALYREAEEIMADSKDKYVPVDIGVLRASGFVDLPEISGNRARVQLGYGGAAEEYAFVQHERLDFHHIVGQAKYLERPMLEAASGLESRLAADLRSLR
jgi:hypothetical protein